MEDKTKKRCTKCRKAYYIKALHSEAITNIPLFLPCGHSMCEICLKSYVTNDEPIECAVCHQHADVSPADFELLKENSIPLQNVFPVDTYTVGEITLQELQDDDENGQDPVNDYFVKIEDLIKLDPNKTGKCVECKVTTLTMCEECDLVVCKNCFTKSHKYVFFKQHQLKAIVPRNTVQKKCTSHPDKRMEYYCKNCSKNICMDCFMMSGEQPCHGHYIVSIHDENENIFPQLEEIMPEVDKVFRRLTKTAVEIGNRLTLLTDDDSINAYSSLMDNIDANFSKLNRIIQQQKQGVTQQLLRKKIDEINSLKKAKNHVEEILTKAKALCDTVKSLNEDSLKEENLAFLLDEAKAIVNAPWFLRQQAGDESVGVVINENVYTSLNDYIKLEGPAHSEFQLMNTQALIEANEEIPPAPTSVICPADAIDDLIHEVTDSPTSTRHIKYPITYDGSPNLSNSVSTFSLNSTVSDSWHEEIQIRDDTSEVNPKPMSPEPQPETADQEPLKDGWKEIVYISHIENPNNIYVHRASQLSLVQDLKEEFKAGIFYNSPPAEYVTEGKILLVYNFKGRFWQRCRIVSIERNDAGTTIYNVFCFDFGTNEAVEIESLRYVPPGRIQSPPPLAINCSLVNCQPIEGIWTNNDSLLIQKIIDNKQAVIHIIHVNFLPGGLMQLECDITTFEEGISISHALAFHGRARIPLNVPYPTTQTFAVWKKPKICKDDYKIPIADVIITHIACPEHFYVRKINLEPEYKNLCNDIEKEYRFTIQADIIYLPEKLMVCVAHVHGCGLGTRWARGVVVDLQPTAKVRVFLIDIGTIVELHWRDLRRIHKKFTVQLAYATECYLYDVTPRENQWCLKSTEYLASFKNTPLEMHIKEDNRSSLGIELYDKNDNLNIICINDEMVNKKFAIYFGCNKNIDANKLLFADEKKKCEVEVKEKLKFELNILHYESPSLMYAHFIYTSDLYAQLFDILNMVYSKTTTEIKIDWKVGDKCCVLYNETQCRRAVILEVKNQIAKVFYYDFALFDTIPFLYLREIHRKLAIISGAAVLCHIQGVKPRHGEEWPSSMKEFLEDLFLEYSLIGSRYGEFKGESLPLELWVPMTVEGGASEPTREWLSLRKLIIDKGFGIPDKQETENKTTKFYKYEDPGFYKLSHDSIPIDATIIRSLKLEFKELIHEFSPTYAEINPSNDWLLPEPLFTNKFTAMITHISPNGVIYLRNIRDDDTLKHIHEALEVFCSKPDPDEKSVKWTVGEPCIALCSLDNRIYRGKVLKVNKTASTCLIHAIDYGKEDLYTFKNLRKTIILHRIPTLAQKCILNRIQPMNKHWNPQSIDFMRKSILNKQCYVTVSGPHRGEFIPIEIKYNNMLISDHLVRNGMAKYAEGTMGRSIPSDFASSYIKASLSFYKRNSFDGNDWVQILGGEERQSIRDNALTYSPYTKAKFTCYINVLNEPENLELKIIHDAETVKVYQNMFKELQSDGKNMPALTSMCENKACVVKYQTDSKWYRASILDYSKDKKQIILKYVDYGKIEIVRVADVKEITEKYTMLPPSTMTVTLHGVKLNPNVEKNIILEYYKGIFFNKDPFVANVINGSNIIPSVELRNNDGELLYESLMEQNILIKCD